MYTYIGIGLMSVFAMMVIPGNFDTVNNGLVFYGAGTITQFDKGGYEVFSQTVHNRVVDTGEDFIIDASFQDGSTDVADNVQFGSICIGDQGTVTVAETEAAGDFDGDNGITENNCKEDTTVVTSASVATINPATFTCGGTNCADGDIITGFAVCQNDVTDDLDFNNCATEGVMLAVIDSADTTLNAGETLDITYNFDISSAAT